MHQQALSHVELRRACEGSLSYITASWSKARKDRSCRYARPSGHRSPDTLHGRATKRIDELQAHTKEYTATLQLGATTASYDMEHPVDATYPTEHITRELIETTLPKFVGEIQQVPPAYSACKVNGDRAYKLMRKGRDVELKPKTLRIDEIELLWFDPEKMQMSIRVVCGKGTYIRALARDIGEALNSGAYLTALCRTRVGDIRIEDCIKLDDVPAWLEQQTIEDKLTENI